MSISLYTTHKNDLIIESATPEIIFKLRWDYTLIKEALENGVDYCEEQWEKIKEQLNKDRVRLLEEREEGRLSEESYKLANHLINLSLHKLEEKNLKQTFKNIRNSLGRFYAN